VQEKTQKVLGYLSRKLQNAETQYPAYDRELLGIRNAILYWKFNLHGSEQPFLVHMDHATLRWILIQPHLTVHQMDILTVLQNFDWEVRHILGVKNQVAHAFSRRLDFRRKRCNFTALEVTAAGERFDDIKVGIIDDEWFGPIAHCLANPSPHPPPSTASTKECKLWVAGQQFYLEENGLLWLCGDLEKTQVNKTPRAKEKEEVRKADNRGRLCISRTMQRLILHEAHDTPAEGHFSAEQTYLCMKDRFFWKQMWRDTQRYVAGCDMCHRNNRRSRKSTGLLQSLLIAKGHWQRIGINSITDLLTSGSGHNCIVTFVNHMTKRAHWRACKKRIDAPAFARIFIDDIIHLHRVHQEVVSD
jgi:hypothetical protein